MKYKNLFSENYYRAMWDRMAEKHTVNDPERNLKIALSGYCFDTLPEDKRDQAMEVVKEIEAQRVYSFLSDSLKGTMKTIIAIQTGKASLGYTTQRQEIEAMHDLVSGFEFDCLRLADFKKKYNLGA